MSDTLKGKIAQVIDEHRVVLNIGSNNGVEVGFRFSVYSVSEDIIYDPDTKKPLGKLEIPLGTGKVINVQDNMCILESDQYHRSEKKIVKTTTPKGLLSSMYEPQTVTEERPFETIHIPFDNPEVGDSAIYLPSFSK